MQQNVLHKLHSAHQGMDRTKRRARQACYWPKMNNDIEKMVRKCYFSSWPEVYQLKEATSKQVIAVMKDTFSRHGIPSELVSDNGSQYKSHKFRQFAKEWDFKHEPSSPHYPRSNGLAESSVKTVKTMIKKCLATNRDIKQGLLTIRNTPLSCGLSPAQLLMNRQLNDNLPRIPSTTTTNKSPCRNLMAERRNQKHHHDKNISKTTRETFRPGQRVALQNPKTKEWTVRGRIIEEVAPRSYNVQVSDKSILRRNRIHIRKLHSTTSTREEDNTDSYPDITNEPPVHYDSDSDTSTIPYDDNDATVAFDTEHDAQEMQHPEQQTTARSRRIRKAHRPVDYDEL